MGLALCACLNDMVVKKRIGSISLPSCVVRPRVQLAPRVRQLCAQRD